MHGSAPEARAAQHAQARVILCSSLQAARARHQQNQPSLLLTHTCRGSSAFSEHGRMARHRKDEERTSRGSALSDEAVEDEAREVRFTVSHAQKLPFVTHTSPASGAGAK